MTNNHGTALQKVFIFLAILTLVFVMLVGGFGYFYVSDQQKKIDAKENELQNLKNAQATFESRIQELEGNQKKLSDDNARLVQETEKYASEKSVILNQVKTSVASFEVFRKDATDEIVKLKDSVKGLEDEKKNLTEKLSATESGAKEERKMLEERIGDLSRQIDEHKKIEEQLSKSIEVKERVPIVMQSAKLHYNLGNFYFRQKQYRTAIEEYKEALQYTPEDADIHYNLAVVSDDYLADAATAMDHYRKYMELNPKAKDFKKIQLRVLDLEIQQNIKEAPMDAKSVDKFNTSKMDLATAGMRKDK